MRIGPAEGAHLSLKPECYEYPGLVSVDSDWFDANWLVVGGTVRTADARTWNFRDPCLLTAEAYDLSGWLCRASAGDIEPLPTFDEYSPHVAAFTEPNIAFSLASRNSERLEIRVHLSFECGPPWRSPGDHDAHYKPYILDLHSTAADLDEAAATWLRELEPFPVRGTQ